MTAEELMNLCAVHGITIGKGDGLRLEVHCEDEYIPDAIRKRIYTHRFILIDYLDHRSGRTEPRPCLTPSFTRAMQFIAASVCPIPPAEDGSKAPRPGGKRAWQEYQDHLPSISDVYRWYQHPRSGVGVVCGAVSGGLEALDFDDLDALDRFQETCSKRGLSGLLNHIKAGYFETTPHGAHLLYRCESVGGSQKLAEEVIVINGIRKRRTLIETRGEGAYIITAPSHGSVNSAGIYEQIEGGPDTIVWIDQSDRNRLLDAARAIDQSSKLPAGTPRAQRRQHRTVRSGNSLGLSGSEFNVRASWHDVLLPFGWAAVWSNDRFTYWQRPGKEHGVSAVEFHDSELLYCHTTSTPLEAGGTYSKFGALAVLAFNGDHRLCAHWLAQEGYNERFQSGGGFDLHLDF
ncbi:bifunctional DNA primase/polymerase [Noviherbaspirillum sp.]|uniref:bifunctional DNA primase/polymerase n=1 Tax=Noviherbaspirillum sp. TaxID=1926288 RepID=UPI002FE0B913